MLLLLVLAFKERKQSVSGVWLWLWGHMGVPHRVFLLQGLEQPRVRSGWWVCRPQGHSWWGRRGAGRLSCCSSREEGAGRPTSPLRVRLTHRGQLLLAVWGGRPPWHFGKETLPERQQQWPWQKLESREPQPEGFKWEHGEEMQISSGWEMV